MNRVIVFEDKDSALEGNLKRAMFTGYLLQFVTMTSPIGKVIDGEFTQTGFDSDVFAIIKADSGIVNYWLIDLIRVYPPKVFGDQEKGMCTKAEAEEFKFDLAHGSRIIHIPESSYGALASPGDSFETIDLMPEVKLRF